MSKAKIATVWLDGCSGCHMSFLDLDQRLLEVFDKADLVYSPLVDVKEFPDMVDVTIVEGAVSTNEEEHKIKKIRAHTKILVVLGDCAVTGNVPSMRNPFGTAAIFERAYHENSDVQQQNPSSYLPVLAEHSRPVHEVVKVDVFVPGCPPPADAIYFVVSELLAGRIPDAGALTRFGK
ncbi:MAG TPA: hypothetical protein VHD56_05735 [Tepidisphaeraceae bacterium]|nr:hypothetical protein [Tepidisphaeraceae bacterium]